MKKTPLINYCTLCGGITDHIIPKGDNRLRYVCQGCGEIHYQNPKVVAGCIVTWQTSVLLCKRAIKPRLGYWTIPAGYLENDETIEQGALRETREEACAKVKNPRLYQIYNLSPVNQVYILYRAELVSADSYGIGEESLDTMLVEEPDIPWDDMAFEVIRSTLRRFLSERKSGIFSIQVGTLDQGK